MNCPGSIALSAGMPNESNVYARGGTVAHFIASDSLERGTDAIDWLGGTVENYEDIEIDEEMCNAVQIYLDTVRAAIQEYADAGFDDYELGVEIKFDLSHIYAGMFGTCDAALYLPQWKKLVVYDYKHGYVSVPVEKNKQTMYYGLGALTGEHNRAIETVELVIVQPNSLGESIKRWSCGSVEMLDFMVDLKAAAAATEAPDAELKTGDWCKYCPASIKCKALEQLVVEKAMAEFDVGGTIQPKSPKVMTQEQLKAAWENANIIEAWAKNIKSYAHQEAVSGNILPGCKLVQGKANRKWRNAESAATALKTLMLMYDFSGDIYTQPKLKTPKQIEDMLGKNKKAIEGLWEKGVGSLSLVPDSDERAPARVAAEDEFSGLL